MNFVYASPKKQINMLMKHLIQFNGSCSKSCASFTCGHRRPQKLLRKRTEKSRCEKVEDATNKNIKIFKANGMIIGLDGTELDHQLSQGCLIFLEVFFFLIN